MQSPLNTMCRECNAAQCLYERDLSVRKNYPPLYARVLIVLLNYLALGTKM